jgi:NADH-quinone oxidoreductase subunit J
MEEPIFRDLQPVLFWVIAGLTAGSAVMTMLSQNIVRSATWLLFTLGGTSGIFFLLGADFVGATQLLVYVGGTLILVIFGVMLTAQGPFITMRTSAAEWALSLAVGTALYFVLAISAFLSLAPPPPEEGQHQDPVKARALALRANLPRTVREYAPRQPMSEAVRPKQRKSELYQDRDPAPQAPYTDTFGVTFSGLGRGPAHKEKNAQGQEEVVRTSYLLPFEIVSVHLLVVLIGAAYLARAKRRQRRDEG